MAKKTMNKTEVGEEIKSASICAFTLTILSSIFAAFAIYLAFSKKPIGATIVTGLTVSMFLATIYFLIRRLEYSLYHPHCSD